MTNHQTTRYPVLPTAFVLVSLHVSERRFRCPETVLSCFFSVSKGKGHEVRRGEALDCFSLTITLGPGATRKEFWGLVLSNVLLFTRMVIS